ncbi:glutathione synthetase [Alginatibacterium sediminis]|uniref:Glutathione synthetase n=1 Tax=Alginatibacterium sediminis TaxID=2164068 RepID=A0A420E6N1_9ALTE|nr:SemiSWEET transporter [Alginatibacterium sediminis]RKF13720.1 glutathione synthetase [Alginatibacterium sediminis]
MDAVTILGLIAACLTTISFVPQALMTIRTKDTKSISLSMYLLFVLGVALWLVYGVYKADTAIIFANALTLLFSGFVLFIKIKNDVIN